MASVLILMTMGMVFVLVALPVVNYLRVASLAREIAQLRQRLEAIERGAGAPSPARAPAAPPAPDADASVVPAAAPVPWREAIETPAATPVSAPAEPSVVPPPLPSVPPPALAEQAVAAPPSGAGPSFEHRIGARWLLYTGVAILLLGVGFFLKYAFDSEWVGPAGRVLMGAAAGIALIAGGSRLAGRGLSRFGLALSGTGFVMLDLSIYAALDFYGLIGRPTAFALFSGVTVGAAWQAHRTRDEALALIAVIGGYMTPFLVGGDANAQVALFSYDLVLGLGVMAVATRHRWLALFVVSLLFTVLTVGAWAGEWYTPRQWLSTLGFLSAFCVLFLAMLGHTRRLPGAAARLVTGLLWSAPVVYHGAALAVTWSHAPALHVYLIVATALGLLTTTDPHRGWLRVLLILAIFVPFLGYVSYEAAPSALTTNTIAAVALAVLHVSALLDRSLRQRQILAAPELVATHLVGIGLFGLLAQVVRPDHADWRGAIGAVLAMGASGLWFLLEKRDPRAALNTAGLAFTLVALAVAVEFEGQLAVIGWGVEGAVAAWVGLRAGLFGFRAGGLVLWLLAATRLNESYLRTPEIFTAIWNDRALAALTLVALAYALARRWRAAGDLETVGPLERWVAPMLHVAATVVTLQWIAAETRSYWAMRPDLPQVQFYEQLTLSLGFAVYAAALIVAGLRLTVPSLRWIGMAVMAMTVAKVYAQDLWELGGIFRVLGFLVIGVILVAVSYLYQRRSGSSAPPREGEPAPPLR